MLRIPLAAALLQLCALLPAQDQVCSTTHVGPGCGSTLTVSFPTVGNHHAVQLDVAGLFPHELGGMSWGVDALTVPGPVIPGSPCLVYSTMIWGHTFIADPSGSWTWSRAWPPTYNGHFYMQVGNLRVLSGGGFEVTVTNCVLAECHQQ